MMTLEDYRSEMNWIHRFALVTLVFLSTTVVVAQSIDGNHSCTDPRYHQHQYQFETMMNQLVNSKAFAKRFESTYHISYQSFAEVNGYFVNWIQREILDQTYKEGGLEPSKLETLYLQGVEKFKQQDELLFEIPANHGVDVYYYGKHSFNPIEKKPKDDGEPKTLNCYNAGFENNNWGGWQTICATATNGVGMVTNPVAYTPPGGCSSPAGSPQQHSLWTGGNDAIGGFPRVFQGGVSAMLGNGAQAGSPVHQAAQLVKTFLVDPNHTMIQYSYAAVLDNGGGHPAAQQPFFSVRLLVNGVEDPCAAYSATAGDGQPGWQQSGTRYYRNWTTIAVPLAAYVGQTVTLEFTVSDCFVAGGSHYAYAYVDVSCDDMEVESFCQGTSTVLQAPTAGITSYLWNTGATTSSITVTTPGIYTVDVLPYGSSCPSTLTYNAIIFPTPVVDFTAPANLCVNNTASIVDQTTMPNGGSIIGYQWDFGDGINTPSSTGAISGVPQTTGVYTGPNHTYTTTGGRNVVLTVTTADSCNASFTKLINVVDRPNATITGNTAVCENGTSPQVTFTGSVTPGPHTFTYSVNGGANQTVTTTSGHSVSVPVPNSPAGTYVYNLSNVMDVAPAGCDRPITQSVTVVVNPNPTATISGTATVCQNDTPSPVITFTGANGTSNYRFTYTINGGANQTITSTGTTATLNAPTGTPGTFTYTLVGVEDVATGCSQVVSGPSNTAVITVNPNPTATISGTTTVCQNDTSSPVITFTGANGTSEYEFTYNVNGGANQTITTSGSNSVTIPVPTSTSGTITYNLVSVRDVATGCSQNQPGTASVTINPLPTAIATGTATVCQGEPAQTITFTGSNGTSTYQFTYNLNGGANQTITTTGTNSSASITVPTTTAGTFTYTLVSVQDVATGCSQTQTGAAIVTVNPTPSATISGTTIVCQNDVAPNVIFTGSNSSGDYKFTYLINGGTAQIATTTGGNNTLTITAPTTTAGTFTYNLVNVEDPATGCTQSVNQSAVITVNPMPTATLTGTTTVCQNDAAPSVTFTGANGTSNYEFTYKLNGGANQTITTSGSSSVTITVPTATPGTYAYTLVSVRDIATGCSQLQTGAATVTVNPTPTATITGATTVCQNDAAPTVVLTGNNSSSTYRFTYRINGGANQVVTTSGGSNSVTLTVPTTTSGTVTYTLLNVEDPATGCNQAINQNVTIVINPLPTATIAGTINTCQGSASPTVTFTGGNGTGDYEFTYKLNGGVNQTITTSGGNSATISVPTSSAGTYAYTLISVRDVLTGCSQPQTGAATVVVNPMPTATIAGSTTLCQGDVAPTITFTGSNSSGTYRFTYTINGGPNQTITTTGGSNSATVSVPTGTAGTFTYALLNVEDPVTGCNQAINQNAVVTVNPTPTAIITGNAVTCQNSTSPTVTFTGANGTSNYEFTYKLNGGANQTITTAGTNTATISVPTATAGTYTYTLVSVKDVVTGCSQTQSGTATVTINPMPNATITGTTTVCQGDAQPTVTINGTNTSSSYRFTYTINGGPNQVASTPTGGSSSSFTITTVVPGTYTYHLTNVEDPATGCNQALNQTVTVLVNPTPTATISGTTAVCQGGSAPNVTFTGANGTSNYEFTYQLNGGANQTITTSGSNSVTIAVPTTTAGTYTYTLISVRDVTTNCSQPQTGVATITVNPMPSATIAGSTTVCQGDVAPIVTFTGSNSSGNYKFTYRINGGADQIATTSGGSTTQTATVSTAIPGTYTYTLVNVEDPATGCSQVLNQSVTIVVNPMPTATIAGTATVCQGSNAQTVTFTGANGSSNYEFTYKLNGGSNQTITTSGGNSVSITIPTATPGSHTYTLVSVKDVATGCSQAQTGSATVIINPMPTATIAGSSTVCQGDVAQIVTFTGSNSSGTYRFTYTINGGANQVVTTSGTANTVTLTQATSTPGTYVYNLVSVEDPASGCAELINQTATIVVNPMPTASIQGSAFVCQGNNTPTVTFTGANGTSNYEFTYSINGGVPQTITTSGSNSITVNVPTGLATTYTYNLISVRDVTTGCSQSQTGSAVVTVSPTPMAQASGDINVCQDDANPSVTFAGNNSSSNYVFTYSINNGPSQTITASGSNTVSIPQSTAVPGTYVYRLTNVMDPASFCNTDTNLVVTIVVNALPLASISNPVEVCYMDTLLPVVTITGSGTTNPYTFTYQVNGGPNQYATSTGNSASFQVPTNVVGEVVYTVSYVHDGTSLACGQALNLMTKIKINPLPTVEAGAPFTVCEGTSIVLSGDGAQTYVWNHGVVNAVPFTVDVTKTYTVIGTDNKGCKNTDSVKVTVIPIPVVDFEGINLSGCAPIYPEITNHSTGNLTDCKWYLGTGEVFTGCTGFTTEITDPGCYDLTLVVSTPEGCSNTLTMNDYICVDAVPIASFYPSPDKLTSYAYETQMINETIGAFYYDWEFGDGSPVSHQHSPFHEFPYDEPGIYTIRLIATSKNGCVDTAYAHVELKEELIFYVPNTFTPDGDLYNEVFKPVFTTGFDPYSYTLMIYNRWGEVVFESHDTNVGWDGNYGGAEGNRCQDGTYTWKINVRKKNSDERKEFIGHVNLIR